MLPSWKRFSNNSNRSHHEFTHLDRRHEWCDRRMGTNQHFIRSILAIMKQGGVKCSDGTTLQVKPILTGRNAAKLKHLAQTVASSVIGSHVDYSTDVDQVFADASTDIVFDASGTLQRAGVIAKAVEHGKAFIARSRSPPTCRRQRESQIKSKRRASRTVWFRQAVVARNSQTADAARSRFLW